MCGVAGIWRFRGGKTEDELRDLSNRMIASMRHRGPNDHGYTILQDVCVALAHTRLSVIDTSSRGHQPMTSMCGNYVIVYNGEIYNTYELKNALAGAHVRFRSKTDTEVLLESICEFGVEKTVKMVNGMFAFAVFDKRRKILWLARDRIGIKPLYYGLFSHGLIFASELKTLKEDKSWSRELEKKAIVGYMHNNYIPHPHSIYRNIKKIEPGTLLRIDSEGTSKLIRYWDANKELQSSAAELFSNSLDAKRQLSSVIEDSVKRQMISDVPLGAFLSGGIDSSLVVAMMASNSPHSLQTFSIGYENQDMNELPFARSVSQHIGTNHSELYLNSRDLLDVVPLIPTLFDEPFSDSSQIPTYLICKLARESVTVCLSGDGGDELFGGYRRYIDIAKLSSLLTSIPGGTRKLLGRVGQGIPLSIWRLVMGVAPNLNRQGGLAERGQAICGNLSRDSLGIYSAMHSHWLGTEILANIPYAVRRDVIDEEQAKFGEVLTMSQMQYRDLLDYLPDDILVKVDRSSMAQSLEVRVPFLDHRIVEMAWKLPEEMKLVDGSGKWILKEILSEYLPRRLFDRKKMGFGVPLDSWLRGPIQEWAEDLISPSMLRKHGIFDESVVHKYWERHKTGKQNLGYWIWDVLMFQAWLEINCTN